MEAVGLIPTSVGRIEDTELFREMKDVFVKFGGVCTQMKFQKLGKYSADVYKSHFGNWKHVLLAFKSWLINTDEEFPFLNQLPSESLKAEESISAKEKKPEKAFWNSIGTATYGSFLNFRGLQHSPINEQGVVFLFGMVCFELGFVVEAVRTSYPDCEAKRRINKKNPKRDEWERVKIEFEYFSSNFREHGHNPSDCDVIVCWHHDWPDCPLEVIELKSAISSLSE